MCAAIRTALVLTILLVPVIAPLSAADNAVYQQQQDVVVADSDVFQKHGVGMDVVERFPRTATPIVAVGFIGTQLCEAHGVAMTSGYI